MNLERYLYLELEMESQEELSDMDELWLKLTPEERAFLDGREVVEFKPKTGFTDERSVRCNRDLPTQAIVP